MRLWFFAVFGLDFLCTKEYALSVCIYLRAYARAVRSDGAGGVTKMSKLFKTISKTLSTVLVAAVVLLAILLAGVRLIGLTPYTVLSGSMEPTYHVGSVIYSQKVDPHDLKEGDPITYRMGGDTLVTHRIVEVLDEDSPTLAFRTKGDANDHPDGTPVPADAVVGKPLFSIPYLGFVSAFIQRPSGLLLILGSCAAVLLLSFLIDELLKKPPAAPSSADDAAADEDKPDPDVTDDPSV